MGGSFASFITGGIIDAKFFGVLAMFGAIAVMGLAPWLDTSSVRSGRYRPQFKWWFALLVLDFFVLTWVGAKPCRTTLFYHFTYCVQLLVCILFDNPPTIRDYRNT